MKRNVIIGLVIVLALVGILGWLRSGSSADSAQPAAQEESLQEETEALQEETAVEKTEEEAEEAVIEEEEEGDEEATILESE